MNTELIEIPEVLNVESINGLAVSTRNAILEAFAPFVKDFNEWEKKAAEIQVTDVSQTDLMKVARESRLALVKVRTGADKVRKDLKEESNRYNKAVQEIYNKFESKITAIEEHLEKQEKFKELIEAQERAEKIAARMDRCKEFPDVTSEMVIHLSDEMFETFLNGLINEKNQREEAEKKRIEEEEKKKQIEALHVDRKAELMSEGLWQFASDESKTTNFGELSINDFQVFKNLLIKLKSDHEIEQERIRQENEKLKREAEEREAELQRINKLRIDRINALAEYGYTHHSDVAELTEEEYILLLDQQKANHEAKEAERKEQERIAAEKAEKERAEREKAEAERKRLADELARKEKEEADRKAAEEEKQRQAEAEAARLLNAPDKDKLTRYVKALGIEGGETLAASLELKSAKCIRIADDIQSKFEGFKKWALEQIETIR
jgi:hypothetical protein